MLAQHVIIEGKNVKCPPCLCELSCIIERKMSASGFLANPDDDLRSVLVNVSHLLYLSAPLSDILLIDAPRLRQLSSHILGRPHDSGTEQTLINQAEAVRTLSNAS